MSSVIDSHPDHNQNEGIPFPGVYVGPEFMSQVEEHELMEGIDNLRWDISQSGRRKQVNPIKWIIKPSLKCTNNSLFSQNYGPKTNFKKMKLAHGQFRGFPAYSAFVQQRFKHVPLLADFQTIEQCSLEYDPTKGASIDPHIDDCWIWGERVVTVNCLSDSILTLVRYDGDAKKYNLPQVESYQDSLLAPLATEAELEQFNGISVQVPMPNRSLIVLYGPARYQFEHSVLRSDITSRRVCIAYREFTPMYLNDGCHANQGQPILNTSRLFWNEEINEKNAG